MRAMTPYAPGRRSILLLLAALLLSAAPRLARAEVAAGTAGTEGTPEGLSFTDPLLHPGKLDFHYRATPGVSEFDTMWWTPSIKGGFGSTSPNRADDTRFGGAFFRPLASRPAAGDLIVGIEGVSSPASKDFEAEAEYRHPSGFALGGGFVQRTKSVQDVRFVKASYRGQVSGWHSILTVQGQRTAEKTSPGGYVALYDDRFLLVAGDDGEQWRADFGYVAPAGSGATGALRPAAEVLYVDNSIGRTPGPKTLFANLTLGFKGGFLSHPARLGRAMGPTGLEFGNPLGFLNPTWNRRLDPWEMGSLADFRVTGLETPAGQRTLTYEGVVFPFQPFQLDRRASCLGNLFAGLSYTHKSFAKEVPGVLVGFLGKVSFLQLSLGAEYDWRTHDKTVNVGLIDAF
jgi:hypothetical protein